MTLVTVPRYAYVLRVELTNIKHKYRRVYMTPLDVLVEIGGVGEIIIFTFMMLMTLHSSVVRDMYILNVCIIENEQYGRKSTIKHNQVVDSKISNHDFSIEKYSYFELVTFKYLGFMRKKNPRYHQFKELMNLVSDRLDIKRLIINEGNLNALCNVFMEPY